MAKIVIDLLKGVVETYLNEMKVIFRTSLACVLVASVCQCVSVNDSDPSPYNGPHPATYELGTEKGRADGRAGLSKTPDRYSVSYPAAEVDAFKQGYEVGYNEGIRPGDASGQPVYGQPLAAKIGKGEVKIYEGERKVAVCQTGRPFVEKTKFINEQQQIVIKSRGNHGAATIELYDTATGKRKAQVMAYDATDGDPAWAAGMGE